jgi:hypothetical protein
MYMNAYKSRMQAVCDTKVPIFAKLVTYEIDRIVLYTMLLYEL